MKELPLEPPEVGRLETARITLRIAIGDHVNVGDIIAEIETDMATAEVDTPEAFTLRGIRKTDRGYVLIVEE